jgi:uncharacterized protein YciI
MTNLRLRWILRPTVTALLLAFLLEPISALASGAGDREAGAPAAPRNQFIIRLRPSRTEGAATEEEKAKILLHFEYLKGLLSQGRLILAGMALDDQSGIVIIRAEDRLDAERIMAGDPAVGANIFLAELHPFQVTFASAGN